jgi:hypothetical protein
MLLYIKIKNLKDSKLLYTKERKYEIKIINQNWKLHKNDKIKSFKEENLNQIYSKKIKISLFKRRKVDFIVIHKSATILEAPNNMHADICAKNKYCRSSNRKKWRKRGTRTNGFVSSNNRPGKTKYCIHLYQCNRCNRCNNAVKRPKYDCEEIKNAQKSWNRNG